MIANKFGEVEYSEAEILDVLMQNPDTNISNTTTKFKLPTAALDIIPEDLFFVEPGLDSLNISEYDKQNQSQWLMPAEYKSMDIASKVLQMCKTDQELQRVGQELLLFQEYDLFDLLRYLCYLIDTFRKNSIIWGVGRGSSTASYVLYLLGVHRIDSLYYDLPITDFFKKEKINDTTNL
jgi:DNA polymerase III alpha subunit